MKKYRSVWYEPYIIVSPSTREETERRLGSKDGKFQISIKVWNFPSNWKLFVIPKIVGDIMETEDGNSIVLMQLAVSITDLLIALGICTFACFFMQVSVLIYAPILWMAAALVTLYWKSVRKRFGKRLERLLKAQEQD